MEKSLSSISSANNKAEDERKAEETEVLSEKLKNLIVEESEPTNMDPLEYFSRFLDIPEMILKHLNGKGLITASEVNPSYYNFIASSKVLMKKIQVVFDRDFNYNDKDLFRIPKSPTSYDYNLTTSSTDLMEIEVVFNDKSATLLEDFDLLKNSSRLYRNIKIRRWKVRIEDEIGNQKDVGDYITDSELDFFYSKAHEWKNVSLENVYFRKKQDLWRLLSAIESSVESITVWENDLVPFEDPSSEIESFETLKFPSLKKLDVRLDASFSETLIRFLLNSVAIEELELRDSYNIFSKDIFQEMLENFEKLEFLAITSSIINQIFESWEKFKFRLNRMIVDDNEQRGPSSTNFLNFLKSQNDHLERLMITLDFVDRETFDMIMKMPKLKCLTLWYFKAFFDNEVPNKMSTSITDLSFFHCADGVILKTLLDLMPKVVDLTLESIDEEEFKMLKSMKRKFEKLKVRGELKGVDIKELEEIMTENYTSLENNK